MWSRYVWARLAPVASRVTTGHIPCWLNDDLRRYAAACARSAMVCRGVADLLPAALERAGLRGFQRMQDELLPPGGSAPMLAARGRANPVTTNPMSMLAQLDLNTICTGLASGGCCVGNALELNKALMRGAASQLPAAPPTLLRVPACSRPGLLCTSRVAACVSHKSMGATEGCAGGRRPITCPARAGAAELATETRALRRGAGGVPAAPNPSSGPPARRPCGLAVSAQHKRRRTREWVEG